MSIIYDNQKYIETKYNSEDDYEKDIVNNSKIFFGMNSILINSKKLIETASLGGTIPDGFLFDLNDTNNPNFYLIEVELSTHDFYQHIFPQITKFFAFFKNHTSQKELVDKLFNIINNNNELKRRFKKLIGEQEIYKYISDLVDSSQNILLVIDGDKSELPEIIDTYTDTWGKFVKVIKIKKYTHGNTQLFDMNPDFENIEYIEEFNTEKPKVEINENYHLDGVKGNVTEIYNEIKSTLSNQFDDVIFNPQKYYISIKRGKNIAYIKIRKKKIRIVIMDEIEKINEKIKTNVITPLSTGVQNFYNGPCATVDIESKNNSKEVINYISDLLKDEPRDSH